MRFDIYSQASSLQIYDKEQRKQVKVILLYKSGKDSITFLFDSTELKMGHIIFRRNQLVSTYAHIVSQEVLPIRVKNNEPNQYFWSHSFKSNVGAEIP